MLRYFKVFLTSALLCTVMGEYSKVVLAQANASPNHTLSEVANRLTLRFALPENDLPDLWRNPPVSISEVFRALLCERPSLITDVLTDAFPDIQKPIVVIDPLAHKKQSGKTRISIKDTRFLSGGKYIDVTLLIDPPLRADVPSSLWTEYQANLANLSHRIESSVVKAFPDFSKQYVARHLSDLQQQLEKQLEAAQHDVADAHNEIATNAGLSSEKFSEQLAEISRQQIAAKLSLVGMEAREKAIAEQIKSTQNKMQQKADSDDTIKNLEQLLQLRSERLEHLKKLHDAGQISAPDIQTAETDALSAKIELDKTRIALKRANGGEQLDAWNNELSRMAIDRAEIEARSQYLSEVSAQAEQQLRTRRAVEKLVEEAQPKLDASTKQINHLSRQIAEIQKLQENIEPLPVALDNEPEYNAQPSAPTEVKSDNSNTNSGNGGK